MGTTKMMGEKLGETGTVGGETAEDATMTCMMVKTMGIAKLMEEKAGEMGKVGETAEDATTGEAVVIAGGNRSGLEAAEPRLLGAKKGRLIIDDVDGTLGMLGQLTLVDCPPLHVLVHDKGAKNLASHCHYQCDGAALAIGCTIAHVDGAPSANIDGSLGGRTIELVCLVHVDGEHGVSCATHTLGDYQLHVRPGIIARSLRRLLGCVSHDLMHQVVIV